MSPRVATDQRLRTNRDHSPARVQARPIRPKQIARLSVVIVNYCQWKETAALVRQILGTSAARSGAVEVVIVDNHSPWTRLAARIRRWPGVSLRRWGRNRGFAHAVNEGCRLSSGSWYLLLNPDMTLGEGFIDGVLARSDRLAASEPRAGIVGFQLQNRDGSPQLSTGYFPSLARTLIGQLLPRARRKYRSTRSKRHCRVPWVTGCSLLLRRDCFQELGGLDESFFLYYEDVDLSRRARDQGWTVWHDPSLVAIHQSPLHARPMTPALRLIARHSLLNYARRHWSRGQFHILSKVVRAESWSRGQWAKWQGHKKEAQILTDTAAIAREMASGNLAQARRRLLHVVQSDNPRTP